MRVTLNDSTGSFLYTKIFLTEESRDAFIAGIPTNPDLPGLVGYTVEISDITDEQEAEYTDRMIKKANRQDRITQFKNINWSNITTIAHLKIIVRALVEEVIKDD